jgi:hypothetical protein
MRLPARSLLLLALALPASAAQVTEVTSAFDGDRAVNIDVEATYVHIRADTRLSREELSGGQIVLHDELRHARTVDEVDFALRVGIWRDLDLRFLLPYVVSDGQDWEYAPGASSLANNTIDVSGCAGPGTCTTVQPIIPAVPGHSSRKGFRDPTLGIAWAIFNEARARPLRPDLFPHESPYATWVVGLDYTLPLPLDVDSPAIFYAAAVPGNSISGHEGKKAHVFTAWMAFSKRFGVADPYLRVSGTYAFAPRGNGSFDNCANLAVLADVAAANCISSAWRGETGYKPPAIGALALGSEFVLSEDVQDSQKIALDVRADVRYVGPGRTYTQVADALGKLTYSEEYVNVGATLGFYGRLARWIQFRLQGTAGYDTPHFLTTESIGKDLNGDGQVGISGGPGQPAPEQNPTYDFRLDQPGRRLRAERTIIWGASGTLSISF